jgi:hypothetical protein
VIDVATGAVSIEAVDLDLPTRCGLRLVRHYGTAMPVRSDAAFGPGWRCEYEVTLRRDLEGFTFGAPDGGAVTFDVANRRPGPAFVIENQSAFHELRHTDAWWVVTRWGEDPPVRYWFHETPGARDLTVARIEAAPSEFRLVHHDNAGRLVRVSESHGSRALHCPDLDETPHGVRNPADHEAMAGRPRGS